MLGFYWLCGVQASRRWLRCGVWLRWVSPSSVRPWRSTVSRHRETAAAASITRPRPAGWNMTSAAGRGGSAARARTTRAAWTDRGHQTATVSRVSVTLPAPSSATAASTTREPVNVSNLNHFSYNKISLKLPENWIQLLFANSSSKLSVVGWIWRRYQNFKLFFEHKDRFLRYKL